jgi:hypothetical protein
VSKPTLIWDCEVYCDYFLASFLNVDTGNIRHFELFDGQPLDVQTLRAILGRYRLVGFNSTNFDLPVLSVAMGSGDPAAAKKVANKIILNNMKRWQLGIDLPICDHIDIIDVAPGIASLKIYGGRLHAPKMQDLPIDPDASIDPEQRAQLRTYCENDLRTTLALFRKLEPQIALRETLGQQYGVDLRSKSDAQIAEAVIVHEVEKRMGRKLPKQEPFRLAGESFKYKAPEWLRDADLGGVKSVVEGATFTIAGNGVVAMPKEVADLKIKIGGSTYQMGIGGLHSTEKRAAHHADDDHILVDRDVASYYPAIILNCGLKPASMGDHFTAVYRSIVQRRLAAKRAGDKVAADSLKITINGSFGKFGSPYSKLYSPPLLIQTTVTGQLSLLMLIEQLEAEGIPVVSANTDGIVIKCPRSKVALMELIVLEWEVATGFETEATEYAALYSRDVNNYIAIKPDGVKVKGVYAPAALQKNPTNEIVTTAVINHVQKGIPVDQTIRACTDITKFVSVRTVKGGAVKDGVQRYRTVYDEEGKERKVFDGWDNPGTYLGKAVRWYYALGELGTINYQVNGYTVPRTEGAKPLMDLPEAFPDDVDFGWYIAEAQSVLRDIGAL